MDRRKRRPEQDNAVALVSNAGRKLSSARGRSAQRPLRRVDDGTSSAPSWLLSFFLDCRTLVAAALIGVYFHGEVVAYVARYASQQEINLITIVPPVMAQ